MDVRMVRRFHSTSRGRPTFTDKSFIVCYSGPSPSKVYPVENRIGAIAKTLGSKFPNIGASLRTLSYRLARLNHSQECNLRHRLTVGIRPSATARTTRAGQLSNRVRQVAWEAD